MRTTWCSVDCAITIARDNQSKARAKSAANLAKKEITATKANRKALRELNRKDRRWQHKKTQIAFNRMRVLEEMESFWRKKGITGHRLLRDSPGSCELVVARYRGS